MPIIARATVTDPCPSGMTVGVCVDAVDMGIVESMHGKRHKVRMVFETKRLNPKTGFPFRVSRAYTLSLGKKAKLREDLEAWLGQPLTREEISAGFDLEHLIGVCAGLAIAQNERNGETYANVVAITPADEEIRPSGEYERVCNRPDQAPLALS